ncbi:hypothetical protein [Paenibacillus soyae]|uniref:Uncharacterized protein n=1 Tax=Paenibacillus soyae TaxID=2969249 RepID=A0A9X2MT30_9BACL|nr:hypothetical protein [Paenibacillus soyae]MCR2805338.1 hypothetical protein [Paenibacillus soyae]
MSMCICIQNNDELFIAADTAVTISVDGELFRTRQHFNKLRQIGPFLIFGSGSVDVMLNVYKLFESEPKKTAESLRDIVRKCCADFKANHEITYESLPEHTRDVAVLAAEYGDDGVVVYTMNPTDNFEIKTFTVGPDSSTPHTGGYYASETATFLDPLLRAGKPVDQIVYNAFNHFSGAEVGGNITAAIMRKDGVHFLHPVPINENVRLRYYSKPLGAFLTGAQIMTDSPGVFPRAQMSADDKAFTVFKSDSDYIQFNADYAGSPVINVVQGGFVRGQISSLSNTMRISGTNNLQLTTASGDIQLQPASSGGRVTVSTWARLYSTTDGETLAQALGGIESRLSSLESRVSALESA